MRYCFLAILLLSVSSLMAQNGYVINDRTQDFPVNKILNFQASSSSFKKLNEKLLVVDFFGTWCIPCIKALPHLSALQNEYKDQLQIILVSDETETKLQSFLSKQKNFILPVVVDESGIFTKLFQPPFYPYTVVVGKDNRVLAIPRQEEMTEINISKWIQDQVSQAGNVMPLTNPDSIINISSGKENGKEKMEASENKLVQLSQELMYAAKTDEATEDFIISLKNISIDELSAYTKTDNEKKAFWINLYNAFTQVTLINNSGQYENRGKFFSNKFIEIAGEKFSLDDVEHGILRRSKIKWSLGYFSKLFSGKTENKLRVDKLDYRLHFALNCGAKSCPPIAFYRSESIDQQLDLATKVYLTGETEYNATSDIVKLPALMSWFRRDFGGKRKMIELLKQLSIIPVDKNPKIKFKSYDWTLYLENYKS